MLFFIFALASANKYLVEKEYGFADTSDLYIMDQCFQMSYQNSTRYTKVNDQKYKICNYIGSTNCQGSGDCRDYDVKSTQQWTNEIPANIAHSKYNRQSQDCKYHEGVPLLTLYYGECKKSNTYSTSWVKYEIKDNQLVRQYYKDDKCTQKSTSPADIDKCDVCNKGDKYYCKPFTITNNNNGNKNKDGSNAMTIIFTVFFC